MQIPIYPFGITNPPQSEAGELGALTAQEQINRLGGKGAGLMWMEQQGLRVPPGFIIPTSVWAQYKGSPKLTMKAIGTSIKPYLKALRDTLGYMPLVSVRSGARVSCPGMMDTIHNVGIDGKTYDLWNQKLGDAFDSSYKSLVAQYASVVKGFNKEEFKSLPTSADAIKLYNEKLAFPLDEDSEVFPDATGQILTSIEAVFKSWDNARAKIYRAQNNIPAEWGTAVTIQAMVFGNLNEQSGTGVLFTRNPDTGYNAITGEMLTKTQGEDIVDGSTTPIKLSDMAGWNTEVYIELCETVKKLEALRGRVQDVEFTIENGVLYFLQTRNAKMTNMAILRSTMDMATEGLITKEDVLGRITPGIYDRAQQPILDPSFSLTPHFTGIAACSGVVVGKPVFSAEAAIKATEPVILITEETNPDDIGGMYAAAGVITMNGGLTSHAAVVARGMNKPCITGVGAKLYEFNGTDVVSFDGATGRIWLAPAPVISGKAHPSLKQFEALVRATAASLPVITEVPEEPIGEALFDVGFKVYDPNLFSKIVAMAKKVTKLYLDFGPSDAPSITFSTMFPTGAKTKLLTKLYLIPELHKKLVIIGDVHTPFKKLVRPTTVEDLILAEGEVAVAKWEGKAWEKVFGWKKQEGIQLVSLGEMNPHAKSFLSFEQVLQGASKV